MNEVMLLKTLKSKYLRHRLALTIGAVSLSAVCLTGCSSDKEMSNYAKGFEALNNQSYQEALSFFQAAENENYNKQLVYRGEGMANLGLGQYGDSIICFENALHESNGLVKKIDYDINFYLATAEFKAGDLQGAYDTYATILSLDKNNADACYLRGKTSLLMGNKDAALADFERVVEIDRNSPRRYVSIHNDLLENGCEQEAKYYINQALKNINKPSSYYLGVFNYYLGDYTQARNYFEESKDAKNTAEGIIYLANTYKALGDENYAMTLFEQYVEKNPDSSEIFNELGNLKFKLRDYEGALSVYEAGLKATDTSFKQDLMFNRIVTYEYLHNYNTAAALMKEYISLYPDDKDAAREDIFLRTR